MNKNAPEQVHATCIAINGHAVLICGPSGSGKSDLALRLIDRGAKLISDDRVELSRKENQIMAAAPKTIAGKIEVAGLDIVEITHSPPAPLVLIVNLGKTVERYPMDKGVETISGIAIPSVRLSAHEASAAIKVEIALGAWPAMKDK